MATNATVNVTANTSAAQRAVDALFQKNYTLNMNVRGGQPLGRITGDLSEFNKSMDAANARVIAFGASAGVVMGIQKAFHSLIDSTIEVQKSLKNIGVLLDVTDQTLGKFGKGLFDVAKNTGQSFETASTAAAEFARQGLSLDETLKRTNAALVLSRLSGMGAAESVNTLTASVNSFVNEAVTATEVVNKFANVDAAFAVSSKDLADGVSRVGSSASQAGVSLDQLISLVTAAQVATARGGAVIGNSFKTIFTRLDRPKTAALLESLGIGTTDEEGKAKSTIQLLQELAKAYDGLSRPQQGQIAEKVGGVFQINILKATLADLNKEYSTYNNALKISQSSTDEAYKRNEALNQTYASQLNALKLNATQLSANAGEKLLGPSMRTLIGGGNSLLGGINDADSGSIGAKIGNGILTGLGQALSGPGLALIGGVLIKLLADFSKFAVTGTKDLLGLNNAAKEQADIQKAISEILSKDPSIYTQIASGAMTVNDVAKQLLINLKAQTDQLELQAKLAAQIASLGYGAGVRVTGGIARTTRAAGYIPNFASDEEMEEAHARMLGARNPRAKMGRGTIGGKSFLMNSEEDEIPNFGSNGDSAVIPRYSDGWVPNFVGKSAARSPEQMAALQARREKAELRKQAGPIIDLGFTRAISLIYAKKTAGLGDASGIWEDANLQKYRLGFHKAGLALPVDPEEANLEKRVINSFLSETNNYIKTLGSVNTISDVSQFANSGAIGGMLGNIFETAVNYATNSNFIKRSGGQVAGIDFPQPTLEMQHLFHGAPGQYEAKYNDGQDLVNDVVKKAIKGGLVKIPKSGKAAGYIPALQDSISREVGAGAPKSGIYVKQYSELAGSDNPLGLGVFNNRDEGSSGSERGAMRRKGYARGYIPNFADESSGGVGTSLGAASTELVAFATMLAFSSGGLKEAYQKQMDIVTQGGTKTATAMNKFITGVDVGGRRLGFAIGALAPVLTQTLGSAIPDGTYGGRVARSGVNAVGDIASFAGAGAMFGPWGLAVGAATGALVGLTKVIGEASTKLPELVAAEKKSSEEKTKILSEEAQVLSALENLRKVPAGSQISKRYTSQVDEALGANPAMLARVKAAGYDFENVKEIFVKEANIITEKNKGDVLASSIQSLIEQGSRVSFTEKVARSFDPNRGGRNISDSTFRPNTNSEEIGKQIANAMLTNPKIDLTNQKAIDNFISSLRSAQTYAELGGLSGGILNPKLQQDLSAAKVTADAVKKGILEVFDNLSIEQKKAGAVRAAGGTVQSDVLLKQQTSIESFLKDSGFSGVADIQGIKNTVNDTTSVAKKIDDIIKTTLEGIDKIGGGIKSLFDKDNPFKSGQAISEAVNARGGFGGQIGAGQKAFGIAEAIDSLTGGLPAISEKSSIFKDVSNGLLESLQANFQIAKNSLAPNQYKDITDAIENATGVKGVSYNGTPAGLQSVAQLQSARALGLNDQDTDLGKKLYSQAVEGALKRFESAGDEGKKIAQTYRESAAAVGNDPVARGVFLGNTIAAQQLEELKKLTNNPNLVYKNDASIQVRGNAATQKGIDYNPTINVNVVDGNLKQLVEAQAKTIADIQYRMQNISKSNPAVYGAPQNTSTRKVV